MSNGLTLYQISEEVKELDRIYFENINEETGELDNADVIEELDKYVQNLVINKATDIVKAQKTNEAFISSISDEIKKLQAMKKTMEKKQERFNNFIKLCMIKMNTKEIKTPNGILKLRGSKSVTILDESLIPAKFTTIVQDVKISKTEIKKAIDSGEEVAGAEITENMNLSIK